MFEIGSGIRGLHRMSKYLKFFRISATFILLRYKIRLCLHLSQARQVSSVST
jgi:hypothetical protein